MLAFAGRRTYLGSSGKRSAADRVTAVRYTSGMQSGRPLKAPNLTGEDRGHPR